jgi:hypothetical protein
MKRQAFQVPWLFRCFQLPVYQVWFLPPVSCRGPLVHPKQAFALTATLALLAEDVVVLSPLDATAGFTSAADLAATAGAFTSVLAVAAGVLGGVLAPLDETGFFGFATPSTFRF